MAKLAEQLLLIEEKAFEPDSELRDKRRVPEWARVHDVQLQAVNSKPDLVLLTYSRLPNGPDGEWDKQTKLLKAGYSIK